MFCTECTAQNPATATHCFACNAAIASPRERQKTDTAERMGGKTSPFKRWVMIVPLLIAVGIGSWFAWELASDRFAKSDAYERGVLALETGDLVTASASFAQAGSFRDAPELRQQTLDELAPVRSAYLDGLAALDAGEYETALALLSGIQADLPNYEDIDQRVLDAESGLVSAIERELDLAVVRHEWLTADQLLGRLILLDPENESLLARRDELRSLHAPILYTRAGLLFQVGPDLSDERMLVRDIPVLAPQWSPSRDRIAFLSATDEGNSTGSLYVMQADGTNRELVSETAIIEPYFAWSPDGTQIAFVSPASAGDPMTRTYLRIVIHDFTTGDQRTIDPTEGGSVTWDSMVDVLSPTWSPDGSQLAFVAIRRQTASGIGNLTRSGEVQVIDLATGDIRSLTEQWMPAVVSVSWSPAGNSLLAWEARGGTAWFESNETAIYLIDHETGETERLTARSEVSERPVWSPDGSRFAVVMSNSVLKVRSVPGKKELNLEISLNASGYLSWSPSGDAVLISASNPTLPSVRIELDGESTDATEIGLYFDNDWPNLGLQWSSGTGADPDAELNEDT